MSNITASLVKELREKSGAGMMDCKKALEESNGDFDKAMEIIRKKGQAIASKRAGREATEGIVLAKTTTDNKKGYITVLNCETDFVAKNSDFMKLAEDIMNKAIDSDVSDLESLKQAELDGKKINDLIVEKTGIIGEKLDLSYFAKLESEFVVSYIHAGNKLATIVGFDKEIDIQVAKDVAMQIAAMDPVSIDKDDVPSDVIEKEKQIIKDQLKEEGKPENIIEKIAEGKLNKFFKENTLLNQAFVKDNKKDIKTYLSENGNATVKGFKRYQLG